VEWAIAVSDLDARRPASCLRPAARTSRHTADGRYQCRHRGVVLRGLENKEERAMIYQLQSPYFACNRALLTVLDRARAAVGFAECGGRARVEPADLYRALARTLG
jgi:hypothetical protein